MDIVVVASEAVPFVKTGGLGDVAGALPPALERLGHRVALVLPCYRKVWASGRSMTATGITLEVPVGSKVVTGDVFVSQLPNSEVPRST